MSIHFKGRCYPASNIICNVPCETKWNKTQPNLVMRGFAKNIRFEGDNIYID